jgi:hypothetical protein
MKAIYRLKKRYSGRSAHLVARGEHFTFCGRVRTIDLDGIRVSRYVHGAWIPAFPRTLTNPPTAVPTCGTCKATAKRHGIRIPA